MRPTRPGTLLAAAAICALLTWAIVRATFASLPLFPWTAVPALLLLAIGEAITGRNLQLRLSGRRRTAKPIDPMGVARLAALAKASSVTAAVLGGFAIGFFAYVAEFLDKAVPRADTFPAAGTAISAAALAAAALYLEHCCRAPRPPEERDGPPDNWDSRSSDDRRSDWWHSAARVTGGGGRDAGARCVLTGSGVGNAGQLGR
jgi:hypothetical protein